MLIFTRWLLEKAFCVAERYITVPLNLCQIISGGEVNATHSATSLLLAIFRSDLIGDGCLCERQRVSTTLIRDPTLEQGNC